MNAKKGKDVIRIQLDWAQGPIWLSFSETGEPITDSEIVNSDKKIWSLNKEIGDLYTSYYEFDSHGQACWFNFKQEKADKQRMLKLLGQLKDRLNEINDGSFVIDDRETARVEAL